MINLRPYQQSARQKVNRLLFKKRNPCLVIPTGGGKTKTAIVIIHHQIRSYKKVIILTPQEEIFNQWVFELDQAGIDIGTINSGGVNGNLKKALVCMPLSLVNLLPYMPDNFQPDIIITDEAHHSAADTWEAIFQKWPAALRLGLTATPQRTDGKGLNHLYDEIVQTTDIQELVKAGHLAAPLPIVPEQYLINIPIKNGDYDPSEQARLLGKPKIIGDIIEKYGMIFGGLPVLVPCSNHAHAEKMTESFRAAGWKWDHIHSKLQKSERRRMLREIESGAINGLCTVGIGTEGLDIPGLFGLIWLRRTMSLTIYLQFNGRVLRPMPGKTYGIILDAVGNTFIHGLPEAPREWRLDGTAKIKGMSEESIKMKLCPCCGVPNNTENIYCHFCGALLTGAGKKRKIPAMVDGELVAVDGSEIPRLKMAVEAKIKVIQEEKESSFIPVEIPDGDKMKILKSGLFKGRRKFADAVRRFI